MAWFRGSHGSWAVASSLVAALAFFACVSDTEVGTNVDGSGAGGTGGVTSEGGAGADADLTDSGPSDADQGTCLLPSDTSVLAKLAHATCAPAEGCCQAAGMTFDVAACEQKVIGEYRKYFDSARCLGLEYDETGIAECIAHLENHGKLCGAVEIDYPTLLEWSAACTRIFQRPASLGAPCTWSLECVAGPDELPWCASVPGAGPNDPGQCAAMALLGEGAPTDCGNQGFEHGARCKTTSCSGNKCTTAPIVPTGSVCTAADNCELGAHCDDTCKPKGDTGAPCSDHGQCKAGLRCLSTKVCGGAIGSACVSEPNKLPDCALGPCVGGKCSYRPHLMSDFMYGWSTFAGIECQP